MASFHGVAVGYRVGTVAATIDANQSDHLHGLQLRRYPPPNCAFPASELPRLQPPMVYFEGRIDKSISNRVARIATQKFACSESRPALQVLICLNYCKHRRPRSRAPRRVCSQNHCRLRNVHHGHIQFPFPTSAKLYHLLRHVGPYT